MEPKYLIVSFLQYAAPSEVGKEIVQRKANKDQKRNCKREAGREGQLKAEILTFAVHLPRHPASMAACPVSGMNSI